MKLFTTTRFIFIKMILLFVVMTSSNFLCVSVTAQTKYHKAGNSNYSAVLWGEMTLFILKNTSSSSPTYNSRCLGYIGLTMYESVVNSDNSKKSQVGQLKDFPILPKPDARQKYNWALALSASQATILKLLYSHTSSANKSSIDSLYKFVIDKEKADKTVAERSISFGKEIATAIFEWSKSDGGHEGYKNNFDSTYQLPKGKGYWVAPPNGQAPVELPLHYFWGKNRTFAPQNFTLPVPEMKITYNYDAQSEYYAMMKEVKDKNDNLLPEEKEIAAWWSDDPSQTFSPPGHSYHIASIAIKVADADLVKAAETYARVGMAIADAFINCWKSKYAYHAERPSTFIYYNITTLWLRFWPEPPFPAFYSGHAVQGAATATVLSELYGNNFTFIDDTHQGRKPDLLHQAQFSNRTFRSFWSAAEESAISRLYGGIHSRQDNEVGLQEGKKIGTNINQLKWNR